MFSNTPRVCVSVAGWNYAMAIFDLSCQQIIVPKTRPHVSALVAPSDEVNVVGAFIFSHTFLYL